MTNDECARKVALLAEVQTTMGGNLFNGGFTSGPCLTYNGPLLCADDNGGKGSDPELNNVVIRADTLYAVLVRAVPMGGIGLFGDGDETHRADGQFVAVVGRDGIDFKVHACALELRRGTRGIYNHRDLFVGETTLDVRIFHRAKVRRRHFVLERKVGAGFF